MSELVVWRAVLSLEGSIVGRARKVAGNLMVIRRRPGSWWLTFFTAVGAIAASAGAFIAIGGLLFVSRQLAASNEQIELSARFSEQSYLQDRGQDFLTQEYASRETLGCIYDWWFSDGEVLTVYGERCRALREGTGVTGEHPSEVYSATMLYVEETLMYFVEESRMSCQSGVQYARELDIWRNDVSEDVSGVFSFYMLYRFGDSAMNRYFSDTPLAADATPSQQLRHFVRMAKIEGISVMGICRKARQFANALTWELDPPDHVLEICGNADDRAHTIQVGSDVRSYCVEIHGVTEDY